MRVLLGGPSLHTPAAGGTVSGKSPPGPWLKVPSRALGLFAGRGIQLPVCEHGEVPISCLATLTLRREQGGISVAARVQTRVRHSHFEEASRGGGGSGYSRDV